MDKVKQQIETHTLLLAKNFRYGPPTTWGTNPYQLVTNLVDALNRAIVHFCSHQEGILYIAKTLNFDFKVSVTNVNKTLLDPELIYLLPYYEPGGPLDEVVENICMKERKVSEIVRLLNISGLITFSDTLWIIERAAFKVFIFYQPDNEYIKIIRQALIISVLSESNIVPLKNFYNEQYE